LRREGLPEQVISCRLPLRKGREAKPFPLEEHSREQAALVVARGGERRQQIIEAARAKVEIALEARRHPFHGKRARSRCG
jgi:hypothetical protein